MFPIEKARSEHFRALLRTLGATHYQWTNCFMPYSNCELEYLDYRTADAFEHRRLVNRHSAGYD